MIEEIKKSISDLGGVHIYDNWYRFDFHDGQRMDIDMSECKSYKKKDIVLFLMIRSYGKGLEDGYEGEMTVCHHYYNDKDGPHFIPPQSDNLSL